MFPLPALLTPLSIAMSLSTATGVFVHDTKLDKAVTLTAIVAPAATAGAMMAGAGAMHLSSDFHTHAERISLGQSVKDLNNQNPRIQPRSDKDRKDMKQRTLEDRNSLFDNNQFNDHELSLA